MSRCCGRKRLRCSPPPPPLPHFKHFSHYLARARARKNSCAPCSGGLAWYKDAKNSYEDWRAFMTQSGFKEVGGDVCAGIEKGERDGVWVRA